MNSQEKMNLLRQVLTLVGGLLAGAGVISASQSATLTNDVITIVPAAVSIGSLAWSVYAHWNMVKVHEKTSVVTGTGTLSAGNALAQGLVK